jgi:hypothetical protein
MRLKGRSQRSWKPLIAISLAASFSFPVTREVAAEDAFVVENADVGNPGECKLESWTSFAANRDFFAATSPSCVFNLGRPVEIGGILARARDSGKWQSLGTLTGKMSLLPTQKAGFGIAITGGVTFNLTEGNAAAAFASIPVTFQVSDQLRINVNAGVLHAMEEDRNLFTWGAGLDFTFARHVTLIAEVFGSDSETGAQAGLRYTPHERVDFDFIYGRNLFGERSDWVTFGVNLRF